MSHTSSQPLDKVSDEVNNKVRNWLKGPGAAVLVLALSLGATLFAWWREHELVRRDRVIQMQDGLGRAQPLLGSLLGTRFESLRDAANALLRQDGVTPETWTRFVQISEWRQRFPGMQEVGYAPRAQTADGRETFVVQFLATHLPQPIHQPGCDLATDPAIAESLQKSSDAGYGIASAEIKLEANETNTAARGIIGLFPLQVQPMRPGTPAANRENLRGFIFFALNQAEYFSAIQGQLTNLPVRLAQLAPDASTPPRTPTQRPFGLTTTSGAWRFLGTLKAGPARTASTPWFVLALGLGLSGLLFVLFSVQARLRREAETAGEKILAHETEILALNRNLEQIVIARTVELNEALAEEKELSQLKSNFISMVSHEIRTPLALILSSSEILSRYLDRLAPEKRQHHLEQINESVQRMRALMEDVLLYSRAEAGRMEFHPTRLDLAVLCRQIAHELASATAARCPIRLEFSLPGESARGDEALLRHILGNLLGNAVKYSAAGSPVTLHVKQTNGEALFEVADGGIGIPEADQAKLFRPFHRGANARHIAGTGLGLVIVRRCVERHGGRFEIHSREGAGTTATVRLPMFSPAHTDFVKKFS